MATYKLRIVGGPYSGRERTLGDKVVSIGRDSDATIQILDRSASRFHCEVFPVGGMWFVRDLLSKNGTYLNAEKLEDEELLREGDVIRIGATELVFESGIAISQDPSEHISYDDDPQLLSHTMEFKVDDLADLQDEDNRQAVEDTRSLQLVFQIGKILGNSQDANAVGTVMETLISGMPADHAIVFLRSRTSGKLAPHTVRNSVAHPDPVIARSIIKRVINESRAVITSDARADARFNRRDSIVVQNISSVVCVPLSVGGQARGVLYVSRAAGGTPFARRDLDLVSSCALQLGLALQAAEERSRQERIQWSSLSAMLRLMELSKGSAGSGERSARAAAALARAMSLGESTVERIRVAALLHRIPVMLAIPESQDTCLSVLNVIEGFAETLPLIENAVSFLQGDADLRPDQMELPERVVLVAVAFEDWMLRSPQMDAVAIIALLHSDPRLDKDIVDHLRSCHLSGSLYQQNEHKPA